MKISILSRAFVSCFVVAPMLLGLSSCEAKKDFAYFSTDNYYEGDFYLTAGKLQNAVLAIPFYCNQKVSRIAAASFSVNGRESPLKTDSAASLINGADTTHGYFCQIAVTLTGNYAVGQGLYADTLAASIDGNPVSLPVELHLHFVAPDRFPLMQDSQVTLYDSLLQEITSEDETLTEQWMIRSQTGRANLLGAYFPQCNGLVSVENPNPAEGGGVGFAGYMDTVFAVKSPKASSLYQAHNGYFCYNVSGDSVVYSPCFFVKSSDQSPLYETLSQHPLKAAENPYL